MMKAFVETTILVDLLLKRKARRSDVKKGLSVYTETELPQYAIKELKRGALFWFVWFHNSLVATKSVSDAIDKIQKISRTPRRNAAPTALEALAVSEESIASIQYLPESLSPVSPRRREELRRREMINTLRAHVFLAWKKRRKSFTRVVEPLSCFVEDDLFLQNERIEYGRLECAFEPCCLRQQFSSRQSELMQLMDVCKKGVRDEDKRRFKALRHLVRTPNRELDQGMCKSLGDAVFALQAPAGSTIVTTNIKDIDPLSAALGKSASRI